LDVRGLQEAHSVFSFSTNTFFSPVQFRRFVTPCLKRLIAGYRQQGFYTIKHTDGNIMPNGMPGGGYLFSTSNCVYIGLTLKRYELVLEIWRWERNY